MYHIISGSGKLQGRINKICPVSWQRETRERGQRWFGTEWKGRILMRWDLSGDVFEKRVLINRMSSTWGRWSSKCKSPEAGVSLTTLRNSLEVKVAGAEKDRRRGWELSGKVSSASADRALQAMIRGLDFVLNVRKSQWGVKAWDHREPWGTYKQSVWLDCHVHMRDHKRMNQRGKLEARHTAGRAGVYLTCSGSTELTRSNWSFGKTSHWSSGGRISTAGEWYRSGIGERGQNKSTKKQSRRLV